MHILETQSLCHTYKGNIHALKNISFIAPRNTRIAIIGSNGAGKSTLFKHFNGVLLPTSGKVFVNGELVTKKNIQKIRRTEVLSSKIRMTRYFLQPSSRTLRSDR